MEMTVTMEIMMTIGILIVRKSLHHLVRVQVEAHQQVLHGVQLQTHQHQV